MDFLKNFWAQLQNMFSNKEGKTFLLTFLGLIVVLIYFLKIRIWKPKKSFRRRRTRYRNRSRRRRRRR